MPLWLLRGARRRFTEFMPIAFASFSSILSSLISTQSAFIMALNALVLMLHCMPKPCVADVFPYGLSCWFSAGAARWYGGGSPERRGGLGRFALPVDLSWLNLG